MPLENYQEVAQGTLSQGPFLSACSFLKVGSESRPRVHLCGHFAGCQRQAVRSSGTCVALLAARPGRSGSQCTDDSKPIPGALMSYWRLSWQPPIFLRWRFLSLSHWAAVTHIPMSAGHTLGSTHELNGRLMGCRLSSVCYVPTMCSALADSGEQVLWGRHVNILSSTR